MGIVEVSMDAVEHKLIQRRCKICVASIQC